MAKHYKAFISYSHSDEKWSRWLHHALEHYRIPAKLRQATKTPDALPDRLHPIFRDRTELASSSNLSESICSAMDKSDALIVVCSPAAANSKWVNEEIRYFQSLGRSGRIFCFIVDGDPERHSADCAFPGTLLNAESGESLPDPLAADSRGDGKRDAMLKVAAGLLNVGIDDLKQRDAQRRLRVRSALSVVLLGITIVTAGFAISAHLARQESELRRSQAENLIGFMLGDLRAKLEPVGRLDLLDAVGDEAMEYFATIGDQGSSEEVYARAMALRQIGEVRFRQGKLPQAQQAFEESLTITQSLYRASPENSKYLFELGQAEFWVGYAALEQSKLDQTEVSFTRYMEYSRQLLARDPDNADYQLELSYAYSNLGTVAFDRRKPSEALKNFQFALELDSVLVSENLVSLDLKHKQGNGYSWIGAAFLELSELEESRKAYESAVSVLKDIHATGDSRVFTEHFAQNLYHLGNVLLHQGEIEQAEDSFSAAFAEFSKLSSFDPDNAIWRADQSISAYHLSEVYLVNGREPEAIALLRQAVSDFSALNFNDPSDIRLSENLALSENLLALVMLNEAPETALVMSRSAIQRVKLLLEAEVIKPRTLLAATIVMEAHGRVLEGVDLIAEAELVYDAAYQLLEKEAVLGLKQLAIKRKLVSQLGFQDKAAELNGILAAAGFTDPRFK